MDSHSNSGLLGAESASHLVRLESKDHEEILDVVDQLRSEGVSKYVDLPQLVVCGDQSSGKSSILEAISGLNFPRKDSVCTRFATELVLRRAPATTSSTGTSILVSITPDKSRPPNEIEHIKQFRSPTLDLDSFADIVKAAEALISSGKDSSSFFKDVLRVEISGPDQPHLTLVDLPGLYHAADKKQTKEGIPFVEELVKSYIKSSRTVILAVISANSEKALQKVTTLVSDVDPHGSRTMGVITKPDRLESGSDLERAYFNTAQNKNPEAFLQLGWHVLKNRKFEERQFSLAERNAAETEFFTQGIWSSMPKYNVGIDTLRPRLSTILKDHILNQLPGFIAETQAARKDTKASIKRLGHARQTIFEQRRYLLHSSEKFDALIRESLNGTYIDAFFGDALEDAGYQRRLRAVVQNRLSDFSDQMHAQGQNKKILDDGVFFSESKQGVQRTVFIEEVRQRMRRSRGRELPGTFNPLIVGELFYMQSQPWTKIANEYVSLLLGDLKKTIIPILHEILDSKSIEGVLVHVVNPRLAELEHSLRKKTAELLQPQRAGHPITYNRDFTDAIQRARDRHFRKNVTSKLRWFFGAEFPLDMSTNSNMKFNMKGLIDALVSQTETDVERFACSEAVDCMEAYYEVAIKKFIDDFSNLAVERCLLDPLLEMFGPRTVEKMADDVVEEIAGEDRSIIQERARLAEKLSVLEKSLTRLNRLDRHKAITAPPIPQPPIEAETSVKNQDEPDPVPETSTSTTSSRGRGRPQSVAVGRKSSPAASKSPFTPNLASASGNGTVPIFHLPTSSPVSNSKESTMPAGPFASTKTATMNPFSGDFSSMASLHPAPQLGAFGQPATSGVTPLPFTGFGNK